MTDRATRRHKPRRIEGEILGLFRAAEASFVTQGEDTLALTIEGIEGDRHAGPTRRTGGREPWYERGTVIRNERQVSILCPAELSAVAAELELPALPPEWLGGNILLGGIPRLSWLPPRTLLMFGNGATIRIDGDNAPCRKTGAEIARRAARPEIASRFARAARFRRGLVGFVEKAGRLGMGERVVARLPEQWIYDPG